MPLPPRGHPVRVILCSRAMALQTIISCNRDFCTLKYLRIVVLNSIIAIVDQAL